jgi:hypothetical protein
MNEHDQSHLSASGRQRRARMLEELTTTMRCVHRDRRLRRRAAAGTFMIATLVALSMLSMPERASVGERLDMVLTPPQPTPGSSEPSVRIVRTDPSILDRYVSRPSSSAIIVDDEGLLETLAAINRPAGLIRSEGRVWLTANVVDPRDDDDRQPIADPPSSL